MPRSTKTDTDRKAFLLRITPSVMAAVEQLAAAELRSINAQIEVLIREALHHRGRKGE